MNPSPGTSASGCRGAEMARDAGMARGAGMARPGEAGAGATTGPPARARAGAGGGRGRARSLVAAALVLPSLLGLSARALAGEGGEPLANGEYADQERRVDELTTLLHDDPSNADLQRRVRALREECLDSGNYRSAALAAGQIIDADGHSLGSRAEADRQTRADRHRYERILLALGDAGKARADLEDRIRAVPSDCTAYRMLAELHRAAGEYREAMGVHAAHLREHAGEAEPLYGRASVALYSLHDPAATRDAIAAMRAAGSVPGVSRENAAWLLERAGLLEEDLSASARDGETLHARERLLDLLLAGAAAFLLAAWWGIGRWTRPRK